MKAFCSFEIVTPTTSTPYVAAACSESEPQPQPMSRWRWPGFAWSRPSLRQTRSSLSRWASSSVYDGSSLVK